MLYHKDQDGRNGRVIEFRRTLASERLLDLPETGELWIERGIRGWAVHHVDYDGDHAAIVADGLSGRATAIKAALAYASECIASSTPRPAPKGAA